MKALLFIVLLAGLVAPALAQDEQPGPRPMQKDPNAATVFALLLPGGGHLYAGETRTGAALMVVAFAGPVIGELVARESDEPELPRVLGSAVWLGTWVYSLVDAARSARRTNRRNGYAVAVHPSLIENRPALAMRVPW